METQRTSAAALVSLWTSVAAFVLMAVVVIKGDDIIFNGTNVDDIGSLDGLAALAAVVLAGVFGLAPLVVALTQSVLARTRGWASARAAVSVAFYTACCGAITAGYWLVGAEQTAQDRRVDPTALRHGELMTGSSALIGLLPLAIYLIAVGITRPRPPVRPQPQPSGRRSGSASSPR
ncbi:hypothetical protein ABIE44_003331 [Marmoricola sp. OAE513]|uniref:hypothetical protein n=1 Tax=Marmoricola sp. OAE513 TaxID=2817894 RepID=UPI001AE6EBBD